MGLFHRVSDLFSIGARTISEADLLTEYSVSRGSSCAPSLTWLPEASVPTAMDSQCQEDTEKTFQHLIHHLGGREAVLVVGDIYTSGSQCERGRLCRELAQDLFQRSLGSHRELREGATREGSTATGYSICPARSRSIAAKLILFVFHEEWLKQQEGRATVREILKDVRQRCQLFAPTVLGLIYCQSDGTEISECQTLLAHSMAEIFHIPHTRAPACVSAYIKSSPSSILNTKRLICELLTSSDTGETVSLPLS
ncbi:hypothetical protein chiPu_0023195 [Chiloscyllium punctatum]|uniref:Uncharacterized protein n=1 Tax=Chiloscyllium punctatum TaxID=137246 RepID=A0A401T963_CHIPU|nr:hypothetical protein [Chiloscyllium punctatum]